MLDDEKDGLESENVQKLKENHRFLIVLWDGRGGGTVENHRSRDGDAMPWGTFLEV